MKKILTPILFTAFLCLVKYFVTSFFVAPSEEAHSTADEVAAQVGKRKLSVSGRVGEYDFVDLDLPSGTKWATCNVGATKPTEYGDFFAWGETQPKENYCWETYKWCTVDANGDIDKVSKYVLRNSYGEVDNKQVLDAEDDAATANWGRAWRIPTKEQQRELIKACDWEWVKDFNGSGVTGYWGTSKGNGETIFLPGGGFMDGNALYKAGNPGFYLSSSLFEDYSTRAYYIYFYNSDYIFCYHNFRYIGQNVRAVVNNGL
ncbi:MAG: hypothetical protein MJZ24_08110 [Paludibacteraceae bacterium]|nr:hypothetical protein [Candidatus Physcocola equi]MCQ2234681.1 hypothetical protein [Paludibacteraceae bacterium]